MFNAERREFIRRRVSTVRCGTCPLKREVVHSKDNPELRYVCQFTQLAGTPTGNNSTPMEVAQRCGSHAARMMENGNYACHPELSSMDQPAQQFMPFQARRTSY